MSARLLDGKDLAKRLNQALAARVAALPRAPGLAVILCGDDSASAVYVARKGQVAERLGFYHQQVNLPEDVDQGRLIAEIDRLNADPRVDGLLVQLPLPRGLDTNAATERVYPGKDVDGFTTRNAGLHALGQGGLVSCTPLGVMRLLADAQISLRGLDAVVIGRSNIVGRPMARLLEQADATVTVCHRHTRDLQSKVRNADLVVAAVGQPELVRGDWLKPGAVVIDVGMNRLADGRLVGDVHFESAAAVASAITPVPGGVGPLTIAMLMENTFIAACRAQGLSA